MEFTFRRLDVGFRIKFFTFLTDSFFWQKMQIKCRVRGYFQARQCVEGQPLFLPIHTAQRGSQSLMQTKSSLKIRSCHGMIYLQITLEITDVSNLAWFLEHTERPTVLISCTLSALILSSPENTYFGISGIFVNFSLLIICQFWLKLCQNDCHFPTSYLTVVTHQEIQISTIKFKVCGLITPLKKIIKLDKSHRINEYVLVRRASFILISSSVFPKASSYRA